MDLIRRMVNVVGEGGVRKNICFRKNRMVVRGNKACRADGRV